MIESSEDQFFDARDLKPASIQTTSLLIAPTIFQIAEYSKWTFTLGSFPVPL